MNKSELLYSLIKKNDGPITIDELIHHFSNDAEPKDGKLKNRILALLYFMRRKGLVRKVSEGLWGLNNGNGQLNKNKKHKRKKCNNRVFLDFNDREEMYSALKKISHRDFRTIEYQIMSYVAKGLKNDLAWKEKD